MDNRGALVATPAGTTPVVVLAACVREPHGSWTDTVRAAVGEAFEQAGIAVDEVPTIGVGVFAASGREHGTGREHIDVCEFFGLGGTATMLTDDVSAPAVALHLAATAIRARDLDIAVVFGPAGHHVGAVLVASGRAAHAHGWHVRSVILGSAVGALGQGRPPVEVASDRSGVEPGRQRYGLTLRDVAHTVRAHRRGASPIVGHGVSGPTVAAHLVFGPPQVGPPPAGIVPVLALSAPSEEALEELVLATAEGLGSAADLMGMSADATTRPPGPYRVAVPTALGVAEVARRLRRWHGGEPTVATSGHPVRPLTPTTVGPLWRAPLPPPWALAWLWAHGRIRLGRSAAPLAGRAELPPTPQRSANLPAPVPPGTDLVWHERWQSCTLPQTAEGPVCVLGAPHPSRTGLVRALGVRLTPVRAARELPAEVPPTVVQLPESWRDIVQVAVALDRARAPTRLVVVTDDPACIGAARWVRADLPHVFGGMVHGPGLPDQLAAAVLGCAGEELRLRNGTTERRTLAATDIGVARRPLPTGGSWVLGGRLDRPLLDLASALARRGAHPLILVALGPPEPAVLHRVTQLRRTGVPSAVVLEQDLSAHLGQRPLAGVVARIGDTAIQRGHLRGPHNVALVKADLDVVERYAEVAGDVPLWVWAEGRALDPIPGTGVRAITGARLDVLVQARHAPTTVIHTGTAHAAGVIPTLGPLGGVHGVWPR